MQGIYLRKYGVETTVDLQLFETDGVDFKVDAVHASGDTKIMKDEGDEANTTNGFVDEGQGYSITLTATEMEAARIVVYVVDQGTKAWLDTALVIETYGHASAMHAFDLDTATQDVNVASLDNAVITAATIGTGAITNDELATSALNEIADAILARGVSSTEDSADPHSLCAIVLATLEWSLSGTEWTIKKVDGATTFVTKTVSQTEGANPVTGVT